MEAKWEHRKFCKARFKLLKGHEKYVNAWKSLERMWVVWECSTPAHALATTVRSVRLFMFALCSCRECITAETSRNWTSWIWINFIIIWIVSDYAVWSIQLNDVGPGHGLTIPGMNFYFCVTLSTANWSHLSSFRLI